MNQTPIEHPGQLPPPRMLGFLPQTAALSEVGARASVASRLVEPVIRMATVDDAAAVADIYNQAVATAASFDLRPRSLPDQEAWLLERSGAYAAVVAVVEGEVAGFASLSPYKSRPAYSTTVEDSVYVHDSFHGQGLGRALLGELLEVAEAHGFHSVIGRIVGHNEVSIRLHEAFGFRLVGVEREVGRKFNRWLDVVVMQRLLTAGDLEPDG